MVKYQYNAFGTLVSVEGDADNPLSLNRYTYCVNNPLRYTDPSGQFWGAVVKFVVGAVTEYVTQKYIEKRDTIDVKAVVYEGVVGGVTAVIGGVGGAAGKAEKTVKTAKTVVKSAVKTGVKEAAVGFAEDVGYQVFVEDKSLDEVDYGQAVKAGATAGVTAMADEVLDAVAPKKQVSAKNKKKASQATGLIADAADGGPRPKADVLPEGKVKGTVGSAGKANVAAGNHAVGDSVAGGAKKQKVSGTVKAGSTGGISKNQQKVQSQRASSALLNPSKNISGQVNEKLNLQFFAKDTGGKKATAKSTFWGRIHKDKNGVAFDTPISLKQALEELDASGLRTGQTELHISQLNDALDGILNNYNWEKIYSSVYFDGVNRYLVEGHHTNVAFKMLGKNTVLDMNLESNDPPLEMGLYWTKKWYQFWRKTIKIKN